MFRFFLKRYLYKISSQRGLFILALIPALIYLAAAAMQMDRFKIYQKIKIEPATPLALSNSPSDFTSVAWFLAHPDELFLDAYTLQTLSRELQKELPPQPAITTEAQLTQSIKSALSLSYEKDTLRISYSGINQGMGEFLAAFYAKKIMKKAEDGVKRQEMLLARQMQQEGKVTPIPKSPPYSELKGGLTVESERALWRNERLPMTLLLLAAGLAAVLVWIGILELLDTSFKSERQVARMLGLPVLGTVPNMSRISRIMGSRGRKDS
jgi:hypothetical protein